MTIALLGIDPSSRKLAAIHGMVGDEPHIRHVTEKLPQDKPTACLTAYEWVRELIGQYPDGAVYAAIELPVLGRGGPGSTIPQAQINGALLAGAQSAGAIVILVNNSRAKKEIVGRGNASKDDIRRWVKEAWPALYSDIKSDQDLCDSAMIYMYGRQVVDLRDRISRRKAIERATINRRRTPRRKAAL